MKKNKVKKDSGVFTVTVPTNSRVIEVSEEFVKHVNDQQKKNKPVYVKWEIGGFEHLDEDDINTKHDSKKEEVKKDEVKKNSGITPKYYQGNMNGIIGFCPNPTDWMNVKPNEIKKLMKKFKE